jgi:hypothetical protein
MEQARFPQPMRRPFTFAVALLCFGCSDARVTDEPVSEDATADMKSAAPEALPAETVVEEDDPWLRLQRVANWTGDLVVTGPGGLALSSRDDLSGQTIRVRGSSSYYEGLLRLDEEFGAAGRPEVVVRTDENLERDLKEEREAAEAEQETNAGGTEDQLSSQRLEEAFLRRLVALGWLR